jgi:ribosomal-protein-alanine N-acetyltransferase
MKKTARLEIRPLGPRDYARWRDAYLHLKPRNRWDRKPRSPAETTRAAYAKILRGQKQRRDADTFHDLAIFLGSTGELIGNVSLMDLTRGVSHSAYLGYGIFGAHWGQGYGKEAVNAAIHLGFTQLQLHRIEAGIEPRNQRSIALARALGMRHEGCKKRCLFLGGKWVKMSRSASMNAERDILTHLP